MRNEIIDRAGDARLLKHIPVKGKPMYQVVVLDVVLDGESVSQGRVVSRLANARKDLKRHG